MAAFSRTVERQSAVLNIERLNAFAELDSLVRTRHAVISNTSNSGTLKRIRGDIAEVIDLIDSHFTVGDREVGNFNIADDFQQAVAVCACKISLQQANIRILSG